jgi:hypothetical protein
MPKRLALKKAISIPEKNPIMIIVTKNQTSVLTAIIQSKDIKTG